jgi:hypothetical protein
MIERLRNSWELVKASARVLRADSELLVFPFFSGIALVLGYVLLAVVSSALTGVYSAALYQFATTGEAALFEPRLLTAAFQNKR